MSIFLASEEATIAFGEALAKHCQADFSQTGLNIYLHGELGAGKTTLVRGLIQYFLPGAKVKSPTYTLVESYAVEADKLDACSQPHGILTQIYHFDLYRLADPEELEYLGGRDYFSSDAICLVEWPERGDGWLPEPDLEITLKYQADGRAIDLMAHSDKGRLLEQKLLASD